MVGAVKSLPFSLGHLLKSVAAVLISAFESDSAHFFFIISILDLMRRIPSPFFVDMLKVDHINILLLIYPLVKQDRLMIISLSASLFSIINKPNLRSL